MAQSQIPAILATEHMFLLAYGWRNGHTAYIPFVQREVWATGFNNTITRQRESTAIIIIIGAAVTKYRSREDCGKGTSSAPTTTKCSIQGAWKDGGGNASNIHTTHDPAQMPMANRTAHFGFGGFWIQSRPRPTGGEPCKPSQSMCKLCFYS
ncbi:hypothetical protein BDBG_01598 [Blastomyces gilchristii SLH14081]|uniref:Uncharacterized protein n=1 Tax=Blastomyces gilchristii (strain SLH14081) TaxID=559298 RepID=A0A179UAX0_BLAGS|nr:uncharacterized protein BDBG_01598 [Blastomyces gilchristii SLH14081]OAT05166.1 hypothetical protein BDBG_01598 [Blastomyces gilchristii SLH14081]